MSRQVDPSEDNVDPSEDGLNSSKANVDPSEGDGESVSGGEQKEPSPARGINPVQHSE